MPSNKTLTDIIEDTIKSESTKISGMMKEMVGEVRPVGSVKVPREIQDEEFRLMLEMPQLYERFLEIEGAGVETAIKYAHKMWKRMGINNGKT